MTYRSTQLVINSNELISRSCHYIQQSKKILLQ